MDRTEIIDFLMRVVLGYLPHTINNVVVLEMPPPPGGVYIGEVVFPGGECWVVHVTIEDGDNIEVPWATLWIQSGFQALLAAQVEVERKEIMVLPGQNATFMCRVGVPLQYCRIEIPGFRTYNLNKGSIDKDVSYYGQGLEAGQCGFTINQVSDKNNGNIKCTLGLFSEATESIGTMQLIVAKAPAVPELDLSSGTDSLRVYKVGDVLEASCMVKDGRPVANISWYLDDDLITEHNLKMPTVIDLAKENLQSKQQNLTRTLQASDNGKVLRCVAHHPAYQRGFAESQRQLDIKFAPLPIYEPLDKFGYQIGSVGLINVTIEANPKPQIEWTVGGQLVREGGTDNTGRIEAEAVRDLGRGRYLVNLRIAAVNKHDTENDYILKAYNNMGSQDYRIKISTSPEPEGVELGIGAIIGVVVVIMFVILLISILIFAKVSGRWCFSGGATVIDYTTGGADTRNLGESSDTESADVRPRETQKSNPPIKLTALFKKNKDKVASEDEPETRTMETEESKHVGSASDDPDQKSDDEPKEGLVYAELDLVRADMMPVVKNDDEKTEYAVILYAPNGNENESEGQKEPPTK